MGEAKLHITCLLYSESNLYHSSTKGPLFSSLILSSEVYFSSASTSNIMAFFRYSCSYNSTKPIFDFSWLTSGCECRDNVKKEKYVCAIFTVIINLHVYTPLSVFHNIMVFTIIIFQNTQKNISKGNPVSKSAPL